MLPSHLNPKPTAQAATAQIKPLTAQPAERERGSSSRRIDYPVLKTPHAHSLVEEEFRRDLYILPNTQLPYPKICLAYPSPPSAPPSRPCLSHSPLPSHHHLHLFPNPPHLRSIFRPRLCLSSPPLLLSRPLPCFPSGPHLPRFSLPSVLLLLRPPPAFNRSASQVPAPPLYLSQEPPLRLRSPPHLSRSHSHSLLPMRMPPHPLRALVSE